MQPPPARHVLCGSGRPVSPAPVFICPTPAADHSCPLPQVCWLGAWLLLLGFRDYACEQHMRQGLPCLRPSEEAMVQAAQLWARLAAAAEVNVADKSCEPASERSELIGCMKRRTRNCPSPPSIDAVPTHKQLSLY